MGDDLLAQQRPTSTLDAIESGIDLVRSVNGEVERLIEVVNDFNAARLSPAMAFTGGHDRPDSQPIPHPSGQSIDEVARGASGAEPDDHPGPHEIERAEGRDPL